MMEQKPKITIGITCYNAAETIARAIKSAFAQDYPNFEIIIADDCSTDGSVAIIEDLIKGHEHAQLIRRNQNGGPAAARQSLLDAAQGDFIVFFDDDDESLPERIAAQTQKIITYEQETGMNLIACYASGTRLYPNGYQLPLTAIGSQPDIPRGSGVADRLLFYGGPRGFFYGGGTPSCALMARKSTFHAVGGFDDAFRRVEDIDFAIRLALAGGHFIGCPEKLFIQHASEGSDKAPKKNLEAELQLAEKHKTYLQSVGRYYYASHWPLLRYHHFCRDYLKMVSVLVGLVLRYPLKASGHFLSTGSARFFHEKNIRKERAV